MKRFLFSFMLLALFCVFYNSVTGNASLKAAFPLLAAGKSADFAGKWQGNEQCTVVSAPVAIVVITTDGPNQVYLSGVYSMEGKIRGVIKGNTIIIPRQAVIDPKFKNVAIEGSLTLGGNHNTLTGVFAILNNDSRDACTVNYHR